MPGQNVESHVGSDELGCDRVGAAYTITVVALRGLKTSFFFVMFNGDRVVTNLIGLYQGVCLSG